MTKVHETGEVKWQCVNWDKCEGHD